MNLNDNPFKLESHDAHVEITFDLLTRLKSKRGGYNREALAIMGVSWPPKHGWHKELIRQARQNEIKQKLMDTGKNCPHCGKPV